MLLGRGGRVGEVSETDASERLRRVAAVTFTGGGPSALFIGSRTKRLR